MNNIPRNLQYYKFCAYGFLKNLKFFDIFFLLYLRQIGISYLQIGTLYAVRQITVNLFEIPSGLVADTLGRKKAMIFALASYLFSFAIFYFADRYFFLVQAMVLYGCGEAFRSGTHKAMILDYLQQNKLAHLKTRYYGSTRSWSQFGSAISSLLAMLMVFFSGSYRQLFLFTALPYLLDLLLIASYPAALDGGNPGLKRGLNLLTVFRENLAEFFQLFKSLRTLRILFSAASFIALFKTAKDYLQPFLKTLALSLPVYVTVHQEQRSALLIGLVYFALFMLTSYSARSAWKLEKISGDLPAAINRIYLAGVLSLVLAGFFMVRGYFVVAVFLFVGLFLVQNIRRPLMLSYLGEIIESRILASGLSAQSQLVTLLVAILAPLLGLLVDTYGLGTGLMLTGLLFLIIYPLLRLAGKNL